MEVPGGRRTRRETSPASSGRGDTVSISLRAKELSERLMQAVEKKDDAGRQTDDCQILDAEGAAQGSGSGASDGNADAIKHVQDQIKQVSSQLMSVMSGPGTPEAKTERAEPLQHRLNELKQELAALQAEAAKSAQSGSAGGSGRTA